MGNSGCPTKPKHITPSFTYRKFVNPTLDLHFSNFDMHRELQETVLKYKIQPFWEGTNMIYF